MEAQYTIPQFVKALYQYEGLTGYSHPVDISHSSLFERLIDGKKIYKYPPPKAHSQPWYSLLDQGWNVGRIEVIELEKGPIVSVCQKLWKTEQKLADDNYILSHDSGIDEYVLRIAVKQYQQQSNDLWFIKVLETNNTLVEDIYEAIFPKKPV